MGEPSRTQILYPIFAMEFAEDWPFLLVKSGSKYFTKGKATLGVVACASDSTALIRISISLFSLSNIHSQKGLIVGMA